MLRTKLFASVRVSPERALRTIPSTSPGQSRGTRWPVRGCLQLGERQSVAHEVVLAALAWLRLAR